MADTGYTPLAERDQRLYCGSPQQIAREVDVDTIIEHFGEESTEYLALEQRLADQLSARDREYQSLPFPTPRERPRKDHIPGRDVHPSQSKEMLDGGVRE